MSIRRRSIVVPMFLSVLMNMVAGCQTVAHRDNIIFGTDTKFGIDIAPATTSGSAAQFTVGYKRVEFVNMPLLVNGVDSKACGTATGLPCVGSTLADAKYVSHGGPDGKRRDAYSVFASFGAQFGGGSNSTGGGLAQFFATGNAAQALGENTSIGRALAVQDASVEGVQNANDALTKALSETERRLASERGTQTAAQLSDRLRTLVTLASPSGTFDKVKWDTQVDKLSGDLWSGYRTILKSYKTAEEIRSEAEFEAGPAIGPLFDANVTN